MAIATGCQGNGATQPLSVEVAQSSLAGAEGAVELTGECVSDICPSIFYCPSQLPSGGGGVDHTLIHTQEPSLLLRLRETMESLDRTPLTPGASTPSPPGRASIRTLYL